MSQTLLTRKESFVNDIEHFGKPSKSIAGSVVRLTSGALSHTTSYLKNVDQGSGQVVDPELAVGGAGRSAVA